MKIKYKLYVLGAASIAGIVLLIAANTLYKKQTQELTTATNLVDKLEIRLLNLRRNEKDFLLRNDAKYLDKFKKNSQQFLELESQLAKLLEQEQLGTTAALRQDLLNYVKSFEQLVRAKELMGLSDSSGLRGKYNAQLAAALTQSDVPTRLALLQFDERVEQGEVTAADIAPSFPQLYAAATALAKQQTLIGLSYNKGLLGNTRECSHAVEEQFQNFSTLLSENIKAQMQTLSLVEKGLSAVIILFILGIIVQISRNVNVSVNTLLSVIEKISSTNNVGLRVDAKYKDELATVGLYFNSLLSKIEQLILGTQQQSRELTASTTNMQQELNSVIDQFSVQANHTDIMTTSVKEMVSTIAEISESTNVAADGVYQATQNASQGRTVLETTLSNIGALSQRLQGSQDAISSLNALVEQIGGAVTIIEGIAEQTNLLALNAAIEAARAGEQGRGFAVVADEVRSLANRTQQSTEDITNVVSSIQEQMNKVVGEMALCAKQGDETQAHSGQLDANLQKIIDDMHEIQGNSQRIAAAIEEQGTVMNQVSDSIVELNAISEKNTTSAKQVLTEVDGVAAQMNMLDESVSQFKTQRS